MSLRGSAYGWVRRKLPQRLRRRLKALPGMGRLTDSARPTGERWLPVWLGPGLVRNMLLPEGFHWISFEV